VELFISQGIPLELTQLFYEEEAEESAWIFFIKTPWEPVGYMMRGLILKGGERGDP